MSMLCLDYAQARLQSRFGERPDENTWLRLHGIGEIGSYLQTARQTALRSWVLGISPTHDSHDIELALRQKFRDHINEVAHWLPRPWRMAIQWLKYLPDLPAIQYLLDGGSAATWIQRDPTLAVFTDTITQQPQRPHASDINVLVESWQREGTLLSGWLKHWRALQPDPGHTGVITTTQGLRQLEILLRTQLSPPPNAKTPMLREVLARRLRAIFRRYSFQPAAVCAYLALTALDLEQLRGDLLQRALFSTACETSL